MDEQLQQVMPPFYKTLNFSDNEVNPWLQSLIQQELIIFKIVAPRKRKLGDYRYNYVSKTHQITINNDLKEDLFIVTLLHELAHKYTYDRYGRNVLPHGIEWKQEFRKVLNEALQLNARPSLKKELVKHIQSPRASFKQKRSPTDKSSTLAALKQGDEFRILNSAKLFIFQKKLRTRYECVEKATGKTYSVSPFANVIKCN